MTSLFSFLTELLRDKTLVSSAKWWTLQNVITWWTSLTYSKTRRGPRTDPWGTLQFKATRPDLYSYIGYEINNDCN